MFFSGQGIAVRTVLLLLVSTQINSAVYAEIELLTPADSTTTADLRTSSDPLVGNGTEMSIPAAITFSWSCKDAPSGSGYILYLSKDTMIDSSDIYLDGIIDTFVNVFNLEIGRRYFWTVEQAGTAAQNGQAEVYTFTTDGSWPRMMYIDGTTNVRDIGGRCTKEGKMIRQGLLYRSAEFNNTQNITNKGLLQLQQIGIVSEICLKRNIEEPDNVIPWLQNYIRPLSNDGDGMALYVDGLRETPEVVARVFYTLAQKEFYPVIIHCRMGSDRTGEIVAMLEAVLGCSDEQIALNYMWSSLSTMGIRDTTSIYWKEFIDYVKSFDSEGISFQKGSVNYLQSIGVSVQNLNDIREIFLSDENTSSSAMIRNRNRSAAAQRSSYRTVLHLRQPEHRTHTIGGYNGSLFDLCGRCLLKTKKNHARYGSSVKGTGCLIVSENKKIP